MKTTTRIQAKKPVQTKPENDERGRSDSPPPTTPSKIILKHISLDAANDKIDQSQSSLNETLPYAEQFREAHPEVAQLFEDLSPVSAIGDQLKLGAAALMKAADEGNEGAARILHGHTEKLVGWILENVLRKGIMRKLARENSHWPVSMNLTPRNQKQNHKYLGMIDLGQNSGLNVKPSAKWGLKRTTYRFLASEFTESFPPGDLVKLISDNGIEVPEGRSDIDSLNILLSDSSLHSHSKFKDISLRKEAKDLISRASSLKPKEQIRLNRLILEAAYPLCPKKLKSTKRPFVTDFTRTIRFCLFLNKIQLNQADCAKTFAPFDDSQMPQWARDCVKLPALTWDTADDWFELGWQAVMESTNNHPEQDPKLRPLGRYREFHTEGSLGNAQGKATRDSNIRDGIKKRLREAFVEMTGKKRQ